MEGPSQSIFSFPCNFRQKILKWRMTLWNWYTHLSEILDPRLLITSISVTFKFSFLHKIWCKFTDIHVLCILLYHTMLVNVNLDISGYNLEDSFQGYRCGVPQVNNFEQVYSDDHQRSIAVEEGDSKNTSFQRVNFCLVPLN